ncbi:VOC family protein [Haloarchaeobius amylolyticus]|uniref:VOC family protein n=1 Tax=Haloarchaeobius amylolyticus TaxID=1198296 RepID=UPI00226FFA9E|nr:VOC family protein [Haloarchaeobius amylolyticus]
MVTNTPDQLFTHIDLISIIVPDQDEALEWFTETLDFELRQDNPMPEGGRWVMIGVPGQENLNVVLQPPEWGPGGDDPEDRAALIGTDMLTMHTNDIESTVATLRERGVNITSEPAEVPWGTYALFEDPFGNTHQVIEPPA